MTKVEFNLLVTRHPTYTNVYRVTDHQKCQSAEFAVNFLDCDGDDPMMTDFRNNPGIDAVDRDFYKAAVEHVVKSEESK